jgi:hypothetical protein
MVKVLFEKGREFRLGDIQNYGSNSVALESISHLKRTFQ